MLPVQPCQELPPPSTCCCSSCCLYLLFSLYRLSFPTPYIPQPYKIEKTCLGVIGLCFVYITTGTTHWRELQSKKTSTTELGRGQSETGLYFCLVYKPVLPIFICRAILKSFLPALRVLGRKMSALTLPIKASLTGLVFLST